MGIFNKLKTLLLNSRIKYYKKVLNDLAIKYGYNIHCDGIYLQYKYAIFFMGINVPSNSLYYVTYTAAQPVNTSNKLLNEGIIGKTNYTKTTSQKKIEKLFLECVNSFKEAQIKLKEYKIQKDFN